MQWDSIHTKTIGIFKVFGLDFSCSPIEDNYFWNFWVYEEFLWELWSMSEHIEYIIT